MTHIDVLWEIDLTNVERLAEENLNVHCLLVILETFSRFLWIKALKDRKGQTLLDALSEVIERSGRIPNKLRRDKGSEFVNSKVKAYLNKYEFILQKEITPLP